MRLLFSSGRNTIRSVVRPRHLLLLKGRHLTMEQRLLLLSPSRLLRLREAILNFILRHWLGRGLLYEISLVIWIQLLHLLITTPGILIHLLWVDSLARRREAGRLLAKYRVAAGLHFLGWLRIL